MTSDSMFEKIMALPVFDTHTHLETGWRSGTEGFYARSFFDICNYFWFKREQIASRYERNEDLTPGSPEAAKELHAVLRRIRNTAWTQTVMQAMEELYGVRPDSPDRILELSALMEKNLKNADWGNHVCDKIGIRKTVMGPESKGTPTGRTVLTDVDLIQDRIERIPGYGVDAVIDKEDPAPYKKLDEMKAKLRATVESFRAAGYPGVRAKWPFISDPEASIKKDFTEDELKDPQNLRQHLGHYLFECFEEIGMPLQIFFGTGGGYGPLNDTQHIFKMHEIFKLYSGINFELFCMAELSALDMVQVARVYPNVYPGGLWWYTFRPSIYEMNMKYRSEGIPACRATFVASDARCIEWSYIKILMIKRAMAQFLLGQIEKGWLDEDAALYTARCWLHDTAEKLYSSQ